MCAMQYLSTHLQGQDVTAMLSNAEDFYSQGDCAPVAAPLHHPRVSRLLGGFYLPLNPFSIERNKVWGNAFSSCMTRKGNGNMVS